MKEFIGVILVLMTFTPSAKAIPACSHTPSEFTCVTYVRNYDADTITVNIPGVHPLIGNKVSIRVAGIDSPEIRTKNQCEKQLAYEARDFVKQQLLKAQRIDLHNLARGKYFRIVADVLIDDVSLSQTLLEHGYAFPYDGGKKPSRDWCK
ncbi:MAG: thermonuclease family protein [Oligoflexales bacterium]